MTVRRAVWVLSALVVLTGAASGGRDMEYADGVAALGYTELAIEHLLEMRTRAEVPEADKQLIPLRLGELYNALALAERDPAVRERHLAQASRYLEEFAGKNPSHPKILDVSLQQIDILGARAQTSEMRFRVEDDPQKKAEIRKQTGELYQKGLDAAKVIAEKAGEKAKELRPKAASSKKYMDEYWTYYGAQVRGLFLMGHLEYLWAQLYDERDAERKKHLDASVTHFEETIKQRPKTNVTYDAYVRRGMCFRELAPFEKNSQGRKKKLDDAMKSFASGLTVKKTDETAATRAEAHYQKAITALEVGDYEAAVTAADGFLREHPEGKTSYRGQETLLVKARALGKLAQAQRGRNEPEWEDNYAEATRTVKDIVPDYAAIREEADRLVQDWGKIFPTTEVVISPFLTAAQAKKLYQDGNLEQALEKYQEVITLCGDREEYADFAQEAWKTLGKIYYDTRRLYMSSIAWRELLERFPNTYQGEEIAWVRAQMFAYLYAQSQEKDQFDLDAYLSALRFFVEKYPKDPRVFEAQTESAKVYAISGETVKSAEIWSKTDPDNPRYAESMTNSGELYRQAFIDLVEKKQGQSAKAKEYFAQAEKHLRRAADAKLPPDAKENYNAQALARLAEILVDDAAPQPESARGVPTIVAEFRSRFPEEKERTPRVLLSGAQAHVILRAPLEAEKLALVIEKEFPRSYAYETVKQLMTVAFQKTDPARALAWQQKQFRGDYSTADDISLETLGNRAWQQKNYTVAAKCFSELVRRTRGKDPAKTREYEEVLAAVYFEGGKYAEAVSLYEDFLAEARKAFTGDGNNENRNKLLLAMRRLAESMEMGDAPKKAIDLWNEFSGMVFEPDPPKEWFEARYHLANAYGKLGQYNAAKDILKRVDILYGGFGKFPELDEKVKTLRKKTG